MTAYLFATIDVHDAARGPLDDPDMGPRRRVADGGDEVVVIEVLSSSSVRVIPFTEILEDPSS